MCQPERCCHGEGIVKWPMHQPRNVGHASPHNQTGTCGGWCCTRQNRALSQCWGNAQQFPDRISSNRGPLRCIGGIVLLGCATHRHQSRGPFGPPVVCPRVLAHMPFWRPHMMPTMPEHNECACVSTICTHWHMLHNVVVAGCGCTTMWCGKPHMCNRWGMGWIEKAKSRQFLG